MNSYVRLINIVYWVALMLWCAALVSAGVSAMNVFSVLSEDNMPMVVERYAEFPAAVHPRLAASHVMEPIFTTVDIMQFIAMPLVLLMFVLQVLLGRMRLRRPANVVRALCIAAAALLFGYYATSVAPVMNGLLRDWWAAAEAGDGALAESVREQFNQYHTTADSVLKINLLLTMCAIGASAVAFTPGASPGNTRAEPALLRR